LCPPFSFFSPPTPPPPLPTLFPYTTLFRSSGVAERNGFAIDDTLHHHAGYGFEIIGSAQRDAALLSTGNDGVGQRMLRTNFQRRSQTEYLGFVVSLFREHGDELGLTFCPSTDLIDDQRI